ncbi:NAD-dependent epimerase/dehydratase family protein [Paenibacillus oralis]|uniref:NAD-dependent epimerase/dehydratase family protein n=1 Tax=Paenibacillus oralis TaxID=2490856 RepID=A0A3P3UCA6_9BACL|nr:polysaccharide biosynthesis protein [Paenibacillus oralis]RRJ67258.1 NAD-dependent epimerase/dehydratase family protein [Paenibacillus oralis]
MNNKTILITGGTGSWGEELVRQLLPLEPKEIRVFSRNESLQVKMKQAFGNARLQFVIGDICDRRELFKACAGVDYVFHLAALKHVPICEDQPDSALKTNVMGTQNVIDAAIESNVQKVLYVSTDKASNPSNTYGMTKALAEKLVLHADSRSNTRFACLRSGNVLGSAGSVVPLFLQQIEAGQDLSVTDPRMTRFFLTLKDAVRTLLSAMVICRGGEIFVTKMPSCKITDIAQVLIEHSGKTHLKQKVIGIRPGERLHETLISEWEDGCVLDSNEDFYTIVSSCTDEFQASKRLPADAFGKWSGGYCSEDSTLSMEETATLLQRGGFLG